MSDWSDLSKERKDLQKSGDLPEWFTTHGWQMFREKFLYNSVGYRDTCERIAEQLAQHAPSERSPLWTEPHQEFWSWEDAFFDLLWKGYLAPSTPVLANTGTTRGMSVSCSGQYVPDSIDGFYSNYWETALLSKEGFGTSAYLGDVRPRGTPYLNGGGIASGVVDVVDNFVDTARKVSQGSARRGAWAGYLEVDHGDFYEVANYLQTNPDDCNLGWLFSKEFIKRLEDGDEEANKRWEEVCYVKCLTGKGYIWKPDHANAQAPQAIVNSGMRINHSNLCVAPETKILTSIGYSDIKSLEGKKVSIWNGAEFSEVVVRKTSNSSKLIKVKTKFGPEIDCTEYHKFYVTNSYHGKPLEKNASELVVGDKLMKFDLPVVEGELKLNRAYESGFYTGDGCLSGGTQLIYLYHEKRELLKHFGDLVSWRDEPKSNRILGRTRGLPDKFFVPETKYTIASRLDWFAGLLDADGCVHRSGTNEALTLSSVDREFLKRVQLMLQTLGVNSKVTLMREAGMYNLPKNDGSGESGSFECRAVYRLLMTSVDSQLLLSLGLDLKRLKINKRVPQRSADRFNTVISVEDLGRTDETFCFTEEKRNMGMFNGILAGNCIEIALPNDEENTFTCVISSANLTKYREYEANTIGDMIVFLDCVAQDFIVRAKTTLGMEKALRFTEDFRALGLGTLGLHSLFLQEGLPFESFEAHMLNTQIYKRFKEESEASSRWLAEQLGEPKWCKGTGMRNATTMAVAPNMTSALIAGGVSQGIEPIYKLVYTQGTAAGEMLRINPWLVKILREKGLYNDDMIQRINENKGSIQGIDDTFTEDEQLLGRTAFEMDQKTLLRMASVRQQFIDQGQSLNLFFDSDESEEYIAEVLQEAVLDDNILGVYYFRMESGIQASRGECVACD